MSTLLIRSTTTIAIDNTERQAKEIPMVNKNVFKTRFSFDLYAITIDKNIIEINIIGLAIILLRLFHRYVTIMNFGAFVGGSMGIQKKIGNILDQIVKEVDEKDIKEININEYLPKFSYNNKLNDDMVEYIELCLKRES